MNLELATAGESHGPALVAIVSGLPAGLVLDKTAIDADLRRRQEGYGRSPRQQIETDEVEVLAGLRHGRTLGTPLALVVRNRDHGNWTWGMSPWPPEGEPEGKGTKPVTLPRPGHADLAGAQKHGLADVRDALERASARHTAVHVAAGAVAKALLQEIGIEVAGEALPEAGADPAAVGEADRDLRADGIGRQRVVIPIRKLKSEFVHTARTEEGGIACRHRVILNFVIGRSCGCFQSAKGSAQGIGIGECHSSKKLVY